jgi:hypothetical protein
MRESPLSYSPNTGDKQDRIYRLPLSKSAAMMRDPVANPCLQFAGKRVRGTEAFVELVGGQPVRIPRMIFFILTFDENGMLVLSPILD